MFDKLLNQRLGPCASKISSDKVEHAVINPINEPIGGLRNRLVASRNKPIRTSPTDRFDMGGARSCHEKSVGSDRKDEFGALIAELAA